MAFVLLLRVRALRACKISCRRAPQCPDLCTSSFITRARQLQLCCWTYLDVFCVYTLNAFARVTKKKSDAFYALGFSHW